METKEFYLVDTPKSIENEDKFQRYPFAKRIAETIINRKETDSLVIGIYGSWGEGKTSVLNFIETELKKDGIITVPFNPWRYEDEIKLLTTFFKTLASSIIQNLNKEIKNIKFKYHYNKYRKKVGNLFYKYGNLLSIINSGLGDTAKTFGENLGKEDIEEIKKEIENQFNELNKKVVIIIDDIDRLDKNEIHSILRLVKLTGNFKYTTFILSFDDKMVAEAICERYGSGNIISGENFLEKIVQIPLRLPTLNETAKSSYFFDLVSKVLINNEIILTEEENRLFTNQLYDNILLRVITPRSIIRYFNSLLFLIPLLKNEVNIVDLLLIEAIKIFYPEHYILVKNKKRYFIQFYDNSTRMDRDKNLYHKDLEKINSNLHPHESDSIYSLLNYLFPNIENKYDNAGFLKANAEWYSNKRICSEYYFDKYFVYSVIKGEISDIVFENLLTSANSLSIDDISTKIIKIVNESSPDELLRKLHYKRNQINWEEFLNIAPALCHNGVLFPYEFVFFHNSLMEQLVEIIYKIFIIHGDRDWFSLYEILLKESKPVELGIELWRRSYYKESKDKYLLSDEQFKNCFLILKERIITENNGISIFDKVSSHQIGYFFISWSNLNKNEFESYLKVIINKNHKLSLNLLKSLTTLRLSSDNPNPYYIDINKDEYNKIKSIIDVDFLSEKLNEAYSDKINTEKIYYIERTGYQTDENLMSQFIYYYNYDKKEQSGEKNKEYTFE